MDNNQGNNIYVIASSIIVAGLLIAGAVIYGGGKNGGTANVGENLGGKTAISVSPLSDADHALGNRNAPVVAYEYSDLECPFCARLQETIYTDLKADYLDSGKVAWVYRHLPLSGHVGAFPKAEASECVAELGGDDAFFKFVDKMFENEQLPASDLSIVAKNLGLDESAFSSCLNDKKYDDKINSEAAEAAKAGAEGTPFIVIYNSKGYIDTIPGAYPADYIKSVLDKALSEN